MNKIQKNIKPWMVKTVFSSKTFVSDISAKISELNKVLETREDIDPYYTHKILRDLEHKIIFIHVSLERAVEMLIARNIIPLAKDPKSHEEGELIYATHLKIYKVLNEVTFKRKLELAKSLQVIDIELYKSLIYVNEIRNEFAHPDAYELKKYLDPALRFNLLQLLIDSDNLMQKKFIPGTRVG